MITLWLAILSHQDLEGNQQSILLLHADREVRDYIRNCPSCQVQTTYPAKPFGLLQPLQVPVMYSTTVCLAHCHY